LRPDSSSLHNFIYSFDFKDITTIIIKMKFLNILSAIALLTAVGAAPTGLKDPTKAASLVPEATTDIVISNVPTVKELVTLPATHSTAPGSIVKRCDGSDQRAIQAFFDAAKRLADDEARLRAEAAEKRKAKNIDARAQQIISGIDQRALQAGEQAKKEREKGNKLKAEKKC
jgi:hypothetical protein